MGIAIKFLWDKSEKLNSYKSLYETTNKQNQVFQAPDSTWRNRTEVAAVTGSELTSIKELKNLSNEFNGLKKSLRNLELYSQFSQQTILRLQTQLHDTSFFKKGTDIKITGKTVTYSNKWDSVSVLIVGDNIDWTIKHKDSIQIVEYWDRKWFLGKKKSIIEIQSKNPDSKVDYQKSIKRERKRGLFKIN